MGGKFLNDARLVHFQRKIAATEEFDRRHRESL
jgi:hypothetical protein